VIVAPHSYYKDKNRMLFGEQKSEFTRVDFYYIIKKNEVKFNSDGEGLCN